MMKPFESFLAPTLEEYIAYRRDLGYTEKGLRQCLSYLDRYLQAKQVWWGAFSASFFLDFRATLKQNPRTVNGIMSTVHGFFQYLQRIGYCDQNPLSDIPPIKELHFIPFVFSPEQIELLLKGLQNRLRKTEKYFLKDLAEYNAIVLLARCGLRISEPTRLLLSHFRPQEATIYIEKTKFKKDRLIPVPRSVIKEVENYLALRRSFLCEDKYPYLLICGKQKRLTRTQLYPTFNRAVKDMGFDQAKKVYANTVFGRPTPHSLRHSFAINTLMRIKQKGKSPQNALPILAAYMGHRQYRDTAVYLKVIDAQQRLELLSYSRSRGQS
jgi:integrase/recombinase XerD